MRKNLCYFIFLSVILVACNNANKNGTSIHTTPINSTIKRDVFQSDSIQKWRENLCYKNWVESDSMPYFILDKQILRLLKSSKLNETDRLVLNYRLVYNYYYRRFIYDSIQYQNKAIKLLLHTLDSDKDLVRSALYFKTTPIKLEKYVNQIRNAKSNKVQDSLVWHRLISDKRLEGY